MMIVDDHHPIILIIPSSSHHLHHLRHHPSSSHPLFQIYRLYRRVLGQQRKRGFEDASLLCRIMRRAERGATVEAGEGGARWRRDPGTACVPTGEGGGNAFHFQRTRDQSHGLRADRSGRHQQRAVHFLGFGHGEDGWDGLIQHPRDHGLIAHKTDH